LVLDSWLKKFKDRFSIKEESGEDIPENWVPDLLQKDNIVEQKNGTIKILYEEKKTNRYITRRIKRLLVIILIIVNFVMLTTCFLVEGGIMVPFFGGNMIFLTDYFWKTRPLPLDEWK